MCIPPWNDGCIKCEVELPLGFPSLAILYVGSSYGYSELSSSSLPVNNHMIPENGAICGNRFLIDVVESILDRGKVSNEVAE